MNVDRIAELERDARRYRWLRDNTHLRDRGYGPTGQWLEIAEEIGIPWTPIEGAEPNAIIDAAIDARMANDA